MGQKDMKRPSREHEEVYHATSRRQAASLPLTARRLHDLKNACSVEGKKREVFASPQAPTSLSQTAAMPMLSGLKGGRVIRLVRGEHGENDAHPHVGKGSQRHRMTFAFRSLALIVVFGPAFLLARSPRKLVQGVAQRFDTAQAAMRFGIVATLKQHGRGACQRLQALGIRIACGLIPDFRKPAGSKAFACSRQTSEDEVRFMPQKKALDLLLRVGDLLHQRQQLRDQCQCQTRFRARRERIGSQMRLVQRLEDLGRHLLRPAVTGVLEDRRELLHRSIHGGLWGGIALQEDQSRVLLQRARKQLQGHRIGGLESSRELIDQPRLHLDQAILIAGEGLEFLHQLTIWSQSMQISQVRPSRFGEQIGIKRIRFGSRGGAPAIHRTRVDRPAFFQQESDEQAMAGFDDAGHLLFVFRPSEAFQKAVEPGQSFWRVIDSQRPVLLSLLVKHQGVMIG